MTAYDCACCGQRVTFPAWVKWRWEINGSAVYCLACQWCDYPAGPREGA